MRLAGKVAVVTGAASGMGLAIVQRFVAEGAKVLAADWHADALTAALADVGSNAIGMPTNVAEESECEAMVDRAVSAFGRIDILVNNAGVMDLFSSVADMDDATWRRVMGVNLDGPMFCHATCGTADAETGKRRDRQCRVGRRSRRRFGGRRLYGLQAWLDRPYQEYRLPICQARTKV